MTAETVRRRLARYVVRHQRTPRLQAAARLIERLRMKEAVLGLLFEGRDNARRPPATGAMPGDPVARLDLLLREVAASTRPVIVGPWLSEVGFELLYWTPFLRWAVTHYRIDPARVTVISRGGVKHWYSGIADHYIDVFDTYTPDAFRELNEQRWQENAGLQKHTAVSAFDRAILSKAVPDGGDHHLLHPELMYLLFDDYWSGKAGASRYNQHVATRSLKKPSHPVTANLPKRYVAVKFYGRPSFPIDEETRRFVHDFTLNLAKREQVVFMTTGMQADDHGEFEIPQHPNVIGVATQFTPSDNLLAQSSIIAGASRAYCTYGGFAYLPLLYGVPTVGVFSVDKHFVKIHGCAAYQLSFNMRAPLSIAHISAFNDHVPG